MTAMKDYINLNRFVLVHIFFLSALSLCAQENLLPPVRAHHSLVYDEAAKTILLTGGSTPVDGGNSFKFFNDIWSFDGNKWTLKGNAGDEHFLIRQHLLRSIGRTCSGQPELTEISFRLHLALTSLTYSLV